MPSANDPNEPDSISQLIERLPRPENKRDGGDLAALRGWWANSRRIYALPVLAGLLGANALRRLEWVALPALYALHPKHVEDSGKRRHNIGTTCLEVALGGRGGRELHPDDLKAARKTFQARFRRLLACEDLQSDLLPQLQTLMRRAATIDAGVNFRRLGHDLRSWERGSARVKTEWAVEFFRDPEDMGEDAPPED